MKPKRFLVFSLFFFVFAATGVFAQPLTVITYNLGLLSAFGHDYVPIVEAREKAAPRTLAGFMREEQPNLALLEEVWRDSDADAIMKELAPLGYSFVHPRNYSILGLSTGLLLAVRQPLRVLEWKFMPFTKNTFMDSFARKGVLEVIVESPDGRGRRFALVGTHTVALDTTDGKAKDGGQVDVFLAQAGQILAAVSESSKGGTLPVLLLGDFNVGPGYADAEYQKIAGAPGLKEVWAVFSPAVPLVTWDPANPLVRYGGYPEEPAADIDHIFLLDGPSLSWTVREAQRVFDTAVEGIVLIPPGGAGPITTPLSDHYGFLARLDLN
jgi:hypothetical protein